MPDIFCWNCCKICTNQIKADLNYLLLISVVLLGMHFADMNSLKEVRPETHQCFGAENINNLVRDQILNNSAANMYYI